MSGTYRKFSFAVRDVLRVPAYVAPELRNFLPWLERNRGVRDLGHHRLRTPDVPGDENACPRQRKFQRNSLPGAHGIISL
jgi:hypothetical protein